MPAKTNVTLAYCKRLFKKHKVLGGQRQGQYDGIGYVEITPQVVKDILESADENTRIGFEHETDHEWWENGNPRYERWCLNGSVFDDEEYLERMATHTHDQEGSEAPFYYFEEWARHDVRALNAIIKEHFGIEPRSQPNFTSDAFVSKVTLEMVESFCPACGSDEDWEFVESRVEGPVLLQHHECKCGASWDQVYALRGYQNLKMS